MAFLGNCVRPANIIGFRQIEADGIATATPKSLVVASRKKGRLSEAAAFSRRALNVFENRPHEYAANLVKGLTNLVMITARSGESAELVVGVARRDPRRPEDRVRRTD